MRLFALLFALVLPGLAAAADEGRAYPVPVRYEARDSVRSGMHLSFPFREYAVSLAAFDPGTVDPAGQALKELLAAVQTQDYDRAARYINTGSDRVQELGLNQYVDLFRRSLTRFTDITVEGRTELDGQVRFLLTGSTPQGDRKPRLFTFSRRDGGYVFDETLARSVQEAVDETIAVEKVDMLINEVVRNAGLDPAAYPPLPAQRMWSSEPPVYTYHAALTQVRDVKIPPVYLHFRGQPLAMDILAGQVTVEQPVLAFLREAYLSLRDQGMEAFYAYLSPESRVQFQDVVARMSPEQLEELRRDVAGTRPVRFLIDADPVYVVFYAEVPRADPRQEYLRHEWLFRDGQGELQLANLFYQGVLDELFADPAFQARALQPYIAEHLKDDQP